MWRSAKVCDDDRTVRAHGGDTNINNRDWLDLSTMVTFVSDSSGIVSVDSVGTLQLLDNGHEAVGLSASVACGGGGVSVTRSTIANLKPNTYDVDAGEKTGFQFQQSGSVLPIKVRVRGQSGHFITSFQVDFREYDTTVLSSMVADGASFSASSSWSGSIGGVLDKNYLGA